MYNNRILLSDSTYFAWNKLKILSVLNLCDKSLSILIIAKFYNL